MLAAAPTNWDGVALVDKVVLPVDVAAFDDEWITTGIEVEICVDVCASVEVGAFVEVATGVEPRVGVAACVGGTNGIAAVTETIAELAAASFVAVSEMVVKYVVRVDVN